MADEKVAATVQDATTSEASEVMNNINATVILGFVALYIFRRSYKSSTPSINIIKGRLKTFGAWMLKFSILFLFIFSGCITILCRQMPIRRNEIELSKAYDKTYFANIKNYNVDLVATMLFSLKISEIFLISSLFFVISLLLPKTSPEEERTESFAQHNLNSSLGSFSTMWAIFRIPVCLYLDAYKILFDQKITVFFQELISALEFLAIGVFLLILKCKHKTIKSTQSLENMNLLMLACIFYGIFKHAVNLVDLPFILTDVLLQALNSFQFTLQISIFLLCIGIYCPYKKAGLEETRNTKNIIYNTTKTTNLSPTDVMLMPPVIEFDERIFEH